MVQSSKSPQKEAGERRILPSKETILEDAAILICASDHDLRTRVEQLLRAAGFARVAGKEALPAAEGDMADMQPDVILLHAHDESDFDTAGLQRLRALNADGNVSVILMAPDEAPAIVPALLAEGADFLSLDHALELLPGRVFVHASLRVVERTLRSERETLEDIIEKRTSKLNHALNLLRDAEKRLEAELDDTKKESRDRIDYFAETQHELRTPLNAICGMSDAIRSEMFGTLDNPKYKDYAENIYKSGQHLLAIIDGRLEMSRIEAGADPLEIEDVSVGDVINETTEMLGRIAEKANVNLDIDVEPDLPVIATDRRKLRQVLVNLVSNAIKFTPENGNVSMSVKKNAKKGVLVLVVSDTGIGMSSDDVRDAMKPYRRMSGDRRSGERGTGLGLTIVRKLVETLGATIEIQSTPGKGTSVKIELPMAAPDNSQPEQAVA
jgi:signal transduction histidine kinase